jgi:hypothetical protein
MEQEKINKIAVVALIFALLAISQSTTATSEIYNFIAGNNINISQSGNNITITGAATWTLSGLTTDNLTISNDITFPLMKLDHFVGIYTNLSLTDILNDYYGHVVTVQNNLNTVNNTLTNKTNSLNNSVQIVKQTAFEAKINMSVMSPDRTYIPFSFILKNISVQLNNNTGYLNFTVKRYMPYPTNNETLFEINNSAYETTTTGNDTLLNRGNTIEVTYNNWSKITDAIIVFELQHNI